MSIQDFNAAPLFIPSSLNDSTTQPHLVHFRLPSHPAVRNMCLVSANTYPYRDTRRGTPLKPS